MADEKKAAKKRYQRSERRFRRLSNSALESLKPEERYPQAHLDQLKHELEEAHKEVETQAEAYRDLLDSDDETEKPAALATDSLLEELQQDVSRVTSVIAKLSVKSKFEEVEDRKVKIRSEPSGMKLQKFDPPKFSGDTRAFPAFITHYRKHVETQFGKDPFILMKCLSGEAEKHVRSVEENYDEMMTLRAGILTGFNLS